MRRVVITGMGVVSPLGVGLELSWRAALEGRSGVRPITHLDVSDLPVRIAAQVPRGTDAGQFDASRLGSVKELRRIEEFIQFAIAASDEALTDSGWKPSSEPALERTGVMIGSGIGGFCAIADASVILSQDGPRRISPLFIPRSLINEASGMVSIRHGFLGPNHSVVTACATGAHALGDAARLVALGDADVMVAGGAEAATHRLSLAGFSQMKAMSTEYNDRPELASRPWDRARDGFVMGEGAGVVVLEELEHARARGVRIYAEVSGYGMSGDAYHITAPDPEGRGAQRAMRAALARARLNTDEIDYINAHATSTPVGDEIELKAVSQVFGEHASALSMSSTKSMTGHMLGAAGAVEAIFAVLAMRDGVVPPTINLDNPDTELKLDLVPKTAKQRKVRAVLSNSFGFGGTNAALVFTPV